VVIGGAGVVSDTLRIEAELVGAVAGPSVAKCGGAGGGAHGSSGRGYLAAEARAGGRWHRLGVREAAWRCVIASGGMLGGGQPLEARYLVEKRRGDLGSKAGGGRLRVALSSKKKKAKTTLASTMRG
jgi:hypothetical protein